MLETIKQEILNLYFIVYVIYYLLLGINDIQSVALFKSTFLLIIFFCQNNFNYFNNISVFSKFFRFSKALSLINSKKVLLLVIVTY